jgi:hypothetical protein
MAVTAKRNNSIGCAVTLVAITAIVASVIAMRR